MTFGGVVSPGARPRSPIALVVAATAVLGLLGCRVTLRFDQPEAGADASNDARSCTTDQQCESPLPRCAPTKGRCVGCLTTSDCTGILVCDPESWSCRSPDS